MAKDVLRSLGEAGLYAPRLPKISWESALAILILEKIASVVSPARPSMYFMESASAKGQRYIG